MKIKEINMIPKKKATEKGLVKIKQTSINKVKRAIIGKKQTIGEFYELAADEKLTTKK
jgi:phage antirepressor YoqD-like protein